MHPLLDKYICEKYPKIFIERNLPPTKSCMHWGLSVGNGWFSLIETLCKKIQYHIDSHNESVRRGYEWAIKIGEIPQVVALQVKEKFAGLRFYYSGGDDKISGMISVAEDLSYYICEDCGRMDEEVGRNKRGWIQTSCREHAHNSNDFTLNCKGELSEIWKKVKQDEKEAREKAEKQFVKDKEERTEIQLMFDEISKV